MLLLVSDVTVRNGINDMPKKITRMSALLGKIKSCFLLPIPNLPATSPSLLVSTVLPISGGRLHSYTSNRTILTTFVSVCAFMVILIHLETSRVLMPRMVISRRDLHRLTSGFANDISSGGAMQELLDGHSNQRHHIRVCHIGFSHCALTSSILQVLSDHPEVMVNRRGKNDSKGLQFGEQWRKSMASKHKVTVDSSVHFSHNVTSLRELFNFEKHIRVLVTVCHPINRLISVLLDQNAFFNHQESQGTLRPKRNITDHPGPFDNRSVNVYIDKGIETPAKTQQDHPQGNISLGFLHSRSTRNVNVAGESQKTYEKARRLLRTQIYGNNSKGKENMNILLLSKMVNFMFFIQQALTFVPKGQLLIIEENQFFPNKSKELRELFRFLGLGFNNMLHEKTNNFTLETSLDNIDTVTEGYRSLKIKNWLEANDPQLMKRLSTFYSFYEDTFKP